MFSLKLILYFFSFLFLYNLLLRLFPIREGLDDKQCSKPTVYSNDGKLQVLQEEVKQLKELQEKVISLEKTVGNNSQSIISLTQAQTGAAMQVADDQGIDTPSV